MQGSEADRVDKATHMEASMVVVSVDASTVPEDSPTTADANVSTPSKCLTTLLDNMQVTESPPGCLIQVGDGAPL